MRFTKHAEDKLKLLKEHGFNIPENFVEEVVRSPDFITYEKYGRKAAYRRLDDRLALRVIYEEVGNEIVVVTVMVVRRARYEKNSVR
ncbi:hypothetical protein [Archaeoglobus veneficus]|uniref:DUF4258 domain-containing protein n=1 Tax=Archaeoglobus veneficus (strain DSM 11195 / SNP6) TaxID=693661 RepID=F2KQ03_ARCVS|nr:hypothetical protein [Archaeoglobus veneficus]AEA46510.1 hypothetical protein Arcve_0478 [Archaeoglobus veneficus SNP6]